MINGNIKMNKPQKLVISAYLVISFLPLVLTVVNIGELDINSPIIMLVGLFTPAVILFFLWSDNKK